VHFVFVLLLAAICLGSNDTGTEECSGPLSSKLAFLGVRNSSFLWIQTKPPGPFVLVSKWPPQEEELISGCLCQS